MKPRRGHYAALTDVGKVRVTNEDQSTVLTNEHGDVLLVVCDGMGGYNKGDYASKVALDGIVEAFKKRKRIIWPRYWLSRVIRDINSEIFDKAESDPVFKGMGTTLVAVLIRNHRIYVVNSGDSRAYSYSREKGLIQLTSDQTYVEFLAKTGKIKEEEINTHPDRHVLMNAIGIYPSPSFSLSVHEYKDEAILLCSDGLYNNLSDAEIRAVLACSSRVDEKVADLVVDANSNGGSDNIGLAYWECIHD